MPAIVWKGFISFGLVTFPVRLFSAARAEHVRFHMLHRDDLSRVRQVWYCAEEDKPIERADMVKGYEAAKDEFIVVEDAELKKIAPKTASAMEILQFVKEDEVDPIYYEASYYVGPEETVSKPYQLFLHALTETKHHAVAKLTMHSREHIVLIRPDDDALILHTLYYETELHEKNRPSTKSTAKLSAKELQMAKSLVEHLTAKFDPSEFHDTYRENVERLIEEKQKGKKISVVAKPKQAKVVDLMEALKKSLAAMPSQKHAKASGKTAKKTRKAAA
jgi:DNA end-binding protein Ku